MKRAKGKSNTNIVKQERLTNRNPQRRVTALQGVGEDGWGLVKREHPMKEGEVHTALQDARDKKRLISAKRSDGCDG